MGPECRPRRRAASAEWAPARPPGAKVSRPVNMTLIVVVVVVVLLVVLLVLAGQRQKHSINFAGRAPNGRAAVSEAHQRHQHRRRDAISLLIVVQLAPR